MKTLLSIIAIFLLFSCSVQKQASEKKIPDIERNQAGFSINEQAVSGNREIGFDQIEMVLGFSGVRCQF
jgi:outer membrane biogenesis lipoprotein LolB